MQNKLGYLVLNKTPLIMFFYQCNIGQAVRGEIEYISNSKPIIMLLGPGCSKAAMPVAESVHHWNVVQVFQFLFVPNKTIEKKGGRLRHFSEFCGSAIGRTKKDGDRTF